MSTRTLRSLGAATVLALGLLGLVPHAVSARTPDIAITSPGQGASVAAADIAGQASMRNGTVDWVNLRLTSAEGHAIPVVTKNVNGGSGTIPFSWAPATPYNGHYTVEVSAQGTDGIEFNGPETLTATRDFSVEAPPVAPAGLKAAVDQAKRSITVSWTKNPEPDTFAYQVERKQGTTWTKLSTLPDTSTSYTDLLGTLPAGTYQYRVIAARPNAAGDAPIVSAPSLTSGKVTSDPPSPPPSTTAGSGNPKGGGGTTNTTSAGPTSGTSGKPTIASRGKVDLSGFTSLLPQGGGKLPAVTATPDPDTGFDEALPFKSGTAAAAGSAKNDDDAAALGGQSLVSSSDEERPASLLFLAAGLLVTVLLMHVLWLRDEVNKEPLPVAEPGDVPAS